MNKSKTPEVLTPRERYEILKAELAAVRAEPGFKTGSTQQTSDRTADARRLLNAVIAERKMEEVLALLPATFTFSYLTQKAGAWIVPVRVVEKTAGAE